MVVVGSSGKMNKKSQRTQLLHIKILSDDTSLGIADIVSGRNRETCDFFQISTHLNRIQKIEKKMLVQGCGWVPGVRLNRQPLE